MYSQTEQVLERLDEQLLTEPEEEEAADEVAHAEEADARGAGDEDDDQRHPVHVREDARLDVVQVRPTAAAAAQRKRVVTGTT